MTYIGKHETLIVRLGRVVEKLVLDTFI